MVLKMKKILLYLFMISFSYIFSCDENPVFIDCRECYQNEPDYATLILKLDKSFSSGLYPSALITIYLGNIEDNVVLYTFNVQQSRYEIEVALNRKYTISATYTDDKGIKYTAIDTAYPRIRFDEYQCEEPCYYVYDRVVNLSLKYIK